MYILLGKLRLFHGFRSYYKPAAITDVLVSKCCYYALVDAHSENDSIEGYADCYGILKHHCSSDSLIVYVQNNDIFLVMVIRLNDEHSCETQIIAWKTKML